MPAEECCCCSIFPCFTDKKNTVSAQPASSAIGLSTLNVNSPASVGETHTGDSSHAISYSETASPPPRNDLDNIQSHGSHPKSPLAASSSPSIAHERGNQVGSSEPAGANDIGNASPALQSSHETSSSGTAASTANASDNIVSHDSQAISSSGASSSQPYVPSSSTPSSHDSQAICSSGASSSQPYVPSSSTPSPSAPKESDYTTKIEDAARSVDTENVNADLNELSNYISQYLAFIKREREKPSQATAAIREWPVSKCLFKLKEVVGQGVEAVKDFGEKNAKKIAQESLKGVGSMHLLLTGFLVIANIMERFEKISKNKEVCLSLLEGMNTLVQQVKKLQERPGLKEGMKTQIEKAIKLIIEVSLAYCTQIDKPKYILFFSTTAIEEELVDFQKKLSALHNEIHLQMGVHLSDVIEKNICLQKEPSYPQYPLHAFGIKRQEEKVIELLEWESHERAIAVILHGLGGMGKTTLADAVFATLRDKKMEGCKYSFVRLFDNIASVQNIPELQTYILRDLKMGEALAIQEIRRHNEGQNEIALMLQEKEAFIYIDTVLLPDTVEQGRDAIEQLLPTNTMGNLKKLRLLITTRNKEAAGGVCKQRGIKTNFYPIETLPDSEAMKLVKKTLVGGEENIDCNQINRIVDICGGIPTLLIKVAEYINSSKGKREAQIRYEMVISEGREKWNGDIGKEIAGYIFAYEYCDQKLRDALLDICSYFQGRCHWEELSNIVRDLDKLENRSLVTKDVKSMTARVHNVILAIGLDRQGERFKFSRASDFQKFLDTREIEKLRCIKGIWLDENSGQFSIPAQKLDLMGRSLRVLQLGNSIKVEGQCNEIFKELYFFSAGISHLPFVLPNLRKLRYFRNSLEDLQNLCQLPEDFGSLDSLQELNLRGCRSLKSLPESIGNLKWLDSIDLSSTDLKELPDGFCNLSFLTKLTIDNCQRLEELPERFGDVKYLRKLSLVGCSSLKELPDSFSKLNELKDLNLSGCVALKKLCTEFKSLSSLKVLSLKECKELEELPEGFHLLALLEHLCLSDCHKLKGQPMENIVKMNTLQIVDIQRSPLSQERWQQIEVSCIQWSRKVLS